jgi:hypothetical protein
MHPDFIEYRKYTALDEDELRAKGFQNETPWTHDQMEENA